MERGETRGSVSESMRRKKKQREGRKNERAYHEKEKAPKKFSVSHGYRGYKII